jgi:hypothetical protein
MLRNLLPSNQKMKEKEKDWGWPQFPPDFVQNTGLGSAKPMANQCCAYGTALHYEPRDAQVLCEWAGERPRSVCPPCRVIHSAF